MNLSVLIGANLRYRLLATIFNVLLLAMGIAIILTLGHFEKQVGENLTRDLRGIDLVVSGKGSPLQIILSAVYHLDAPTGNISAADADALKKNPLIKDAIPLALGDNYNGFRIVGTTPAYITHFGGVLATGDLFAQAMDAVVGSEVAETHHLKIGDQIIGAHGLVDSSDLHSDFPYRVTGILKETGGVLDRLVLTPVESVWHVHEHPDADDPGEVAYKAAHPGNELTALLISYRSPLAAAQLPRLINKSGALQAASPAVEMARLYKLFGTGREILTAFGMLLLGFAAFGFFVTLSNALQDRQYDIALLRALGATRQKVMAFILAEALTLGVLGTITGLVLTQIFLHILSWWIERERHLHMVMDGPGLPDLQLAVAALVISLLAAVIPAIRAYRLDITATLKQAG